MIYSRWYLCAYFPIFLAGNDPDAVCMLRPGSPPPSSMSYTPTFQHLRNRNDPLPEDAVLSHGV